MRIIVYEYISGGGYARQFIDASFLSEGFAMLRSVVCDFKAAGHEVTVLLDERISRLNPPLNVDCTVPIRYHDEPQRFLPNLSRVNDAIYIIAPETAQTLLSLVMIAEGTGKVSLNCKSDAIAKTADKAAFYEGLGKLGVTPKTAIFSINDDYAKVKQTIKNEFSFPTVVKPVDGIGCNGLSLVKDEDQVEAALKKVHNQSQSERFIVQEYIRGETASVSLLSDGTKAKAITLNKQQVYLASPSEDSSYFGGAVPFDHPLEEKAFAVAKQVVEAISGLTGYIGVDVVLSDDKVFVVDANARLTTSYVGLHRVLGFNMAEALIDAVLYGKLPDETVTRGYACFSKVQLHKPNLEAFYRASNLYTVISPPFPLNAASSCAIVLGEDETQYEAILRLEEAKKHLYTIIT